MYQLWTSNQKAGAAAEIQFEMYSRVLNTNMVLYCVEWFALSENEKQTN